MTSSSADPAPGAPARRDEARGRVLRLVAASLVVAGGLLGASATSPGATSAVYTDTGTAVATVRTAVDFDAPRSVPATAPSATATATATPAPTPTAAPLRDAPRAPLDGRGR